MNNTNNALETLVQRDKQIKKANDKLKASINKLDAELETTTNALSTHASNTNIHTSKEELIQLIVDHLESLDLGITKEVVSVLPTENISDNTLYFVPNDKGSRDEYIYINDKWELVGSTETNFTDYYTKLETDTLLEGKANSVHSHVVSDITDFPTIPTKVSDLTNDSGYITSVSWNDVTSKPNFSKVATSGSYTDLSNTPTIPTKVSQLENDMGFGTGGDTSDCVHKTGDETINGIKTFTSDIIFKNNNIDLTVTPSSVLYSNFIFKDKNHQNVAFLQYAKRNVNPDVLGLYINDKDKNLHGIQITSNNYLLPMGNNIWNLGSPNDKWAKVYSDDIVHTSGNETIAGNKTFSSKIVGNLQGNADTATRANDPNAVHTTGDETINGIKTFTSDIIFKNNNIDLTVTPSSVLYSNFIFKDKNHQNVAFLQYAKRNVNPDVLGLYINDKDKNLHGIQITSNNYLLPMGNNIWNLGSPNDKWAKVYSDDIVHTSGNETINGAKTFTQGINIQNSDIDLAITPTSNKYSQFFFADKNKKLLGVVQYAQRSTGVNDLDLYVYDKNSTAHGIQININNELTPIGDNYSLGSSSSKWKNVYATTYYGNLVGSITINQATLKMTVKDSNSETTRTNDVILANSANTGYGINVAFGGSGNTVVGAGESYTAQLNELAGNSAENLYLTADNSIYFKPGADTFANAKTITLSSAAELSGLAKVTSTSFVGALTGNVTGNCSGSSSSCTGNSASATKASYLDNYSLPGGNKIYLDWDTQVRGYVGLKVDKTDMGGILTTKSITFVKGTNYWYRKHSDGFIEMGGFTNCANKIGSAVTTNMPLAFSNTNYTLIVQFTRGTAGGDRWGNDYSLPFTQRKMTTGFIVYSDLLCETGDKGGGYDWYACGY